VGGLAASGGLGVETHLALVGAVAASMVLLTSPWLIADRPVRETRPGFARPSRQLLLSA
jgi:hypothetical protein